MSLYEDLGVPRDADPAAIKRAYRKRAQKAHPDRGGKEEEFHAITRAYHLLSDPQKRAHYDRTGESSARDPRAVAIGSIAAIISQVIQKADLDHADIIEIARQHVQQQIGAMKAKKGEHAAKIRQYEKALKRLRRKKPGENMIGQMIEGMAREARASIERIEQESLIGKDMLEILNEYEYQADVDPLSPMVGVAKFMFSR